MPGDEVVKQGDRGDSMFFISKGNVAILDDDERDTLAVLGEGSFFGETSLLTAQPRNATVKALEFCNIYSLDKLSFDMLLKNIRNSNQRYRKSAQNVNIYRKSNQTIRLPICTESKFQTRLCPWRQPLAYR